MNNNNHNNSDTTISNNNNTDDENDKNKMKSQQQQQPSSSQQQEHDNSTTVVQQHSTTCGSINNNRNNNNNNKDNDGDDDTTIKNDDSNNNDTTNSSDNNDNDTNNNNIIVDPTESTTEYTEAVEVIMSLLSIDPGDGSFTTTTTTTINNNNNNYNNNETMIYICYDTNAGGHVFEVQRYIIQQDIDPLLSSLRYPTSDENDGSAKIITKTGGAGIQVDEVGENKQQQNDDGIGEKIIDFQGTPDEATLSSLQQIDDNDHDDDHDTKTINTTTTIELTKIKHNTTSPTNLKDGQNETSDRTEITNNNNKSWYRHDYFDQFIQLDTLDVTEFPKWIQWYREENNSSKTSYSFKVSDHIEKGYQRFLKNRTSTNNTNNNDYNDDDNDTNRNVIVNNWCTITKSKDTILSLDMLTILVYQGLVGLFSMDYDTMNEIDAITQEEHPIYRTVNNWRSLPTTSPNYIEAVEYFYNSLGTDAASHYTVTHIGMNFNPTLWRMYRAYLDRIQQSKTSNLPDNNDNNKNNTSAESYQYERRWLFHGTKNDCVVNILRYGFNRSFNRTYAYGRGTYFARDASLSCHDKFASPSILNNNDRFVFMCRVAVGNYCLAKYPAAIIPPYKNSDGSEMYNSTVDTIDNPSIFVTYHDAQVYPEYIIRFQYIE